MRLGIEGGGELEGGGFEGGGWKEVNAEDANSICTVGGQGEFGGEFG